MKPVIAKGNEVHEEDFWIMYKKWKQCKQNLILSFARQVSIFSCNVSKSLYFTERCARFMQLERLDSDTITTASSRFSSF